MSSAGLWIVVFCFGGSQSARKKQLRQGADERALRSAALNASRRQSWALRRLTYAHVGASGLGLGDRRIALRSQWLPGVMHGLVARRRASRANRTVFGASWGAAAQPFDQHGALGGGGAAAGRHGVALARGELDR